MMTIEDVFLRDETRMRFFKSALNDYVTQVLPRMVKPEIHCNEIIFDKISQVYFTLNDVYKKQRLRDGHNTKPSKIAALTALSIFLVRPFFGDNINNEANILEVNYDFAIHCASSILGFEIDLRLDFNQHDRLKLFLANIQVEFIHNVLNNIDNFSVNRLAISELNNIGIIITLFEILEGKN